MSWFVCFFGGVEGCITNKTQNCEGMWADTVFYASILQDWFKRQNSKANAKLLLPTSEQVLWPKRGACFSGLDRTNVPASRKDHSESDVLRGVACIIKIPYSTRDFSSLPSKLAVTEWGLYSSDFLNFSLRPTAHIELNLICPAAVLCFQFF